MNYDNQFEETMKKLKEEYPIEKIVQFDEFNINEKIKENAFMVLNYKELYLKEKNELDRISALRDKIIGQRFDHYRFNFNKELKAIEIKEYYLPQDENVIKINRLYQKQQWRVDFFEMCVDVLVKQGWQIKAFLEEKKI